METRFSVSDRSQQENTDALKNSKYSTERCPLTALLFDGKRTVMLPVAHDAESSFAPENLSEGIEQICKAE